MEARNLSLFFNGFILGHKSHLGATRKYRLGVSFILEGEQKGKTLQLCAHKKVMTVSCLALGL